MEPKYVTFLATEEGKFAIVRILKGSSNQWDWKDLWYYFFGVKEVCGFVALLDHYSTKLLMPKVLEYAQFFTGLQIVAGECFGEKWNILGQILSSLSVGDIENRFTLFLEADLANDFFTVVKFSYLLWR